MSNIIRHMVDLGEIEFWFHLVFKMKEVNDYYVYTVVRRCEISQKFDMFVHRPP